MPSLPLCMSMLPCAKQGDVVGCKLDFTHSPGSMSFSVNGVDGGLAYHLPDHMKGRSNALLPAVAVKAATAGLNFGESPFRHLPPGFAGISKAPAEALTTGTKAKLLQGCLHGTQLVALHVLSC